jgi:cyclopropane fatty-acyl-phospholipid synthase-like methyltransferase
MSGSFSQTWYATFLDSIPAEITTAELDFVERWLPVERFPSLLDLCCGSGRHATPLARRYDRRVDHDARRCRAAATRNGVASTTCAISRRSASGSTRW